MSKGITPVIAIILLLLVTISIAGFALIFFQRTTETASQQAETELEHQASIMSENFVIESADNNKVYVRNLGTQELKSLNFYVNGAKIDSTGTVPAGQAAAITLNDAQLAQQPNDAKLKVTSLGASREESAQFYKDEVIGYWKFDEADRTNVKDYSGNGNDGTFCCESWNDGTPVNGLQQAGGKYGNAAKFDGTNYIDSGDASSMDMGTGDFTITFWVNANNIIDGPVVIAKGCEGQSNTGYSLDIGDGGIRACISRGTGENPMTLTSAVKLETGMWYHIAAVYDRDGLLSVYVDGISRQTKDISAYATSNIDNGYKFTIGAFSTGSYKFNGVIDEVRIYSHVLSPQEIQEDMNSAYPIDRTIASYSFEKTENGKTQDTHNIIKGKYGAAMSFDGTDDYIDAGDGSSLKPFTAITIESWIKPDAFPTPNREMHFAEQYIGNLGYIYEFYNNGANTYLYFYFDTPARYFANTLVGSAGIILGNWFHYVAAYDSTTGSIKLYVNGNQVASGSAPGGKQLAYGESSLGMGGPAGQKFKGVLDEVRILNVARPMS